MLDFDDRIWPKLLARACAEPLASVWFEPIVDLSGGAVAGYRARARYAVLGADDVAWELAARRHGFRARLAAARLAAALTRRADLPGGGRLLVEVEAAAICADRVLNVLRAANDLAAVTVALTGEWPDRVGPVLQGLEVVRSLGAEIALAASGPGHLDPQRLADLAPDFLGVGANLIAGLADRPHRQAALAAVVGLAGALGARPLADGIDDVADLGVLAGLGVALGLGPLIGAPTEQPAGLAPGAVEALQPPDARDDGPPIAARLAAVDTPAPQLAAA